MQPLTTSDSAVRAARRYAYRADCAIDIEGLGRAALACENLSAFGAFFATPVALEEGTTLRCVIPLPGRGHWLVAGRVVRVDLSDAPGIAVAFDGVSAFDRHRLSAAFG